MAFPSGTWDVVPLDLVSIYGDPFALLETPPPTVRPYDGWLRREALRLLDAYRNDPTAALSNSRIEPQHHQISVALRALSKPQARLIIADEVGLGKTIEAGLILKELRARGVLERVLVLTPASLVIQWQTELRSKFNEVFIYHDGAMLRDLRERHPDSNPWDVGDEANVIASVQYARLDGQRDDIGEARWDLVIVDEAHHARRRLDSGANLAYQLLETMRDRVGGFLLLTATPMQLEAYELYSMVELVEPGLFEDYADFERARRRIAAINEQIGWLRASPGSADERRTLEDLLTGWNAPEPVRQADLESPEGREQVSLWLEAQHLLSEAMVRNRKAHVGGFMRRVAHRIPVEPSDEELELEQDVQAYLRRVYVRSPAFGLVLVTFQKLLASSSRALALALERRAQALANKAAEADDLSDDPETADELESLVAAPAIVDAAYEVSELLELAKRAHAIRDTKLDALEEELDALFASQPNQKVLIFTQYLGTLDLIRERLGPKLRLNVFHGGLDRNEKEAQTRAFKTHGQVLVSTEAGGEGRNFQFCHILFNYDLPWNPMRIEQRIGRLDRVGQKHNVLIYNFGVQGTLDERILDVLEHRIRVFTESVGALEPILGDIEERIKEIVLKDATAAKREFDRYELALEERIRRARLKEQQMGDFVMDARSFRRDDVVTLLGRERMAGPEDLERFIVAAFDRYPEGSRGRATSEGGGVFTFELPGVLAHRNDRLRERYRGSFDYRVALDDESLDFFAFGHPLVDALVKTVTEDGSVPPITRLAARNGREGFLVDYEVHFSGVRGRQELLSHVVAESLDDDVPPLEVPRDPDAETTLEPLDSQAASRIEEQSRATAEEELSKRSKLFRRANDEDYEAERTRLEKRFRFQRHHFEQRIQRTEDQIDRLERFGTESERRVLPALRGRIDQDRRRIREVAEERERELAELERCREPGEQIRPIGVTFLAAD